MAGESQPPALCILLSALICISYCCQMLETVQVTCRRLEDNCHLNELGFLVMGE